MRKGSKNTTKKKKKKLTAIYPYKAIYSTPKRAVKIAKNTIKPRNRKYHQIWKKQMICSRKLPNKSNTTKYIS